jgi:hypothetical protein
MIFPLPADTSDVSGDVSLMNNANDNPCRRALDEQPECSAF